MEKSPNFFTKEFPFIKIELIPLYEKLNKIEENLNINLNKEKEKFHAEFSKNILKVEKKNFDISAKSIFFQNNHKNTKMNLNKFRKEVEIIKETKQNVFFITENFNEIMLKKRMIETQKKEILKDFLNQNLKIKNSNDFSHDCLLKLREIKDMLEIAKLSEYHLSEKNKSLKNQKIYL